MNLFYAESVNSEMILLNEEESFHAAKVLRLKPGESVFISDGKGTMCKGIITSNNIKECELKIVERKEDFGKRNYHLHIAVAPTKQMERFEWFVEKAVEAGIDQITPLFCRHSERKKIRTDRIEKIILSAAKQSLKAYLPVLNEMTSFNEFITQPLEEMKLIAHCRESEKKKLKYCLTAETQRRSVLVLVGPEGDFDEVEVSLAEKNGFESISLSESRLRTETAALMAVMNVAYSFQE